MLTTMELIYCHFSEIIIGLFDVNKFIKHLREKTFIDFLEIRKIGGLNSLYISHFLRGIYTEKEWNSCQRIYVKMY